jgi:hypothetical protein
LEKWFSIRKSFMENIWLIVILNLIPHQFSSILFNNFPLKNMFKASPVRTAINRIQQIKKSSFEHSKLFLYRVGNFEFKGEYKRKICEYKFHAFPD